MGETLVNLGMILVGSIGGIFLQKKVPSTFLEKATRLIGVFILAIGLRVFLKYHEPVLVLTSLLLGAGLGIWWKITAKITQLGSFLLKLLLEKKILFPSPSPFNEGFVPATLLFCIGSLAILTGFGASHAVWSARLLLAFLPAVILALGLGWGVLFSVLPLLVIQAAMSFSGDSIQSFFTEHIVADLTGVGGLLIALWGMRISKLTTLEPSDFLPALLVSPLVSWAYYSM